MEDSSCHLDVPESFKMHCKAFCLIKLFRVSVEPWLLPPSPLRPFYIEDSPPRPRACVTESPSQEAGSRSSHLSGPPSSRAVRRSQSQGASGASSRPPPSIAYPSLEKRERPLVKRHMSRRGRKADRREDGAGSGPYHCASGIREDSMAYEGPHRIFLWKGAF